MADLLKRAPWWERARVRILVAVFTVIEAAIKGMRRGKR